MSASLIGVSIHWTGTMDWTTELGSFSLKHLCKISAILKDTSAGLCNPSVVHLIDVIVELDIIPAFA